MTPARITARLLTGLLVVGAVAWTGEARALPPEPETPPPVVADPTPSRVLANRVLPDTPPPLDSILAVDDAMRAFLTERLTVSRSAPKDRMDQLVHEMLSRRGLGIEYDGWGTLTARETFDTRAGNCISFTNLFVALAREAGFRAYFSEVDEVLDQDQRGEVVVNNKHMFATVELENGHYRVDFGRDDGVYHLVRRISDGRAAAHFYNNLGVEQLLAQRPDRALTFFERALELDAELPAVWINKGVAHRRAGEPELAEDAYRTAVRVDGSDPSPYWNLALLYREQGRDDEADELFARVESYRDKSPYHHFTLGMTAMQEGDLDEAIRRFKQAVRRAPGEAELYFALGDALYRRGEVEKALENMKRARRLAANEDKREHYDSAIQALERLRG